MMNVIECNALTKVYGRIRALNSLTCNIEENKITGLIGRNGAGKTTLLKIMAGYWRQTSGEIKVFSEPPFNNLKVSASLIFIDDKITFPDSLRLSDIFTAAANFYENWDMGLATRLFDYFVLNPRQSHSGLSKGMQSTFNMILGLAAHCPLTIFDEPTSGMDAAVRKDFYRALLKDYLQFPRTVVLSSHLLNEIEDVLEDILLISEGQNYLHMPVSDLKAYAVGLRGKAALIDGWIKGKEIFHREDFGKDSSFVVVRNDNLDLRMHDAVGRGVEVSPVSADDICVYLTARNKGGIDDVFSRN